MARDGLALARINGGKRALDERVKLRIGVAAPVPGAVAFLRVGGPGKRAQRKVRGKRAPAEQGDAKVALARSSEISAERHGIDPGFDADAREHLGDRLRDLLVVYVTIIRCGDRHPETIGIAGFRQKLARALRIIRLGFDGRVMAEHAGRDHVRGGQRKSLHDALGDGAAVDGFRQGAAHARVLEGVALERLAVLAGHPGRMLAVLVQVEEYGTPRHRLLEAQGGILAQPREICGRHVLDRVKLPGKKRCRTHRIAWQDMQRHLFPREAAAPVIVVPCQLNTASAREAHELVGSRADGSPAAVKIFAGRVLRRPLLDDLNFGEILRNAAVRRRSLEPDRVAVDDLLGDDGADVGRVTAGAALDVQRAIERKKHIVGRELRSVVKLHAPAQRELPGDGICCLPCCESGNGASALVHVYERVEDVLLRREIGLRGNEVRIERRDISREPDTQLSSKYGGESPRRRASCDYEPLQHSIVIDKRSAKRP